MIFVILSIVEVLMNKVALWISVRADDWTTELAIIASNEMRLHYLWDFYYCSGNDITQRKSFYFLTQCQ